MSEVKRDHREELSDELVKHLQAGVLESRKAYTYMWDDVCIGAALAQEYAQSELVALREELVDVKIGRDTTLADLHRADDIRSDLQQRLTATEQRNAALIESIVALPDEFKGLSGCENTAGVYACIDYISDWVAELTKPTESGASE